MFPIYGAPLTYVTQFIQETQHFMNVFNCCFKTIELELNPPLTYDQLFEMINWLNEMKTEIEEVAIVSAKRHMFEFFMNRFRKSINQLYTPLRYFESDGIVFKRLNFEVKELFYSIRCDWFNLECLSNMNTENISAYKNNFSAEELNVFLRSWQEGKTNRNLKQIVLVTSVSSDMKEVLKDCGAELMDPRTTKLKFRERNRFGYFDSRIYGGIHIRRNDGRLAVIRTDGYDYFREDNVHERQIRKYLRNRDIWNSENSHDKWYEHAFNIYFF
uniref:FBA_2 domain-containing protein n=1 Tax=Caenorhabditis tropicalis TaxID=1561998 RepID=A0A1I7U1E1_9PELO